MADCPITPKDFLGTETGTRLKELCGNDVVKFNAITTLVYNPESKTGFTKDFDDYRLGNDAAQEALEFYNSRHFSVGAQTTKSKFNDIVTRFGYTSTTAKVMANRIIGNNILTFFANDVVKGKFNKDNKFVFCACGFKYAASISLLFSYVEISNTFLLCCIAIWVATAIAVDVCPVSLSSSVQKDIIAILLSF